MSICPWVQVYENLWGHLYVPFICLYVYMVICTSMDHLGVPGVVGFLTCVKISTSVRLLLKYWVYKWFLWSSKHPGMVPLGCLLAPSHGVLTNPFLCRNCPFRHRQFSFIVVVFLCGAFSLCLVTTATCDSWMFQCISHNYVMIASTSVELAAPSGQYDGFCWHHWSSGTQ